MTQVVHRMLSTRRPPRHGVAVPPNRRERVEDSPKVPNTGECVPHLRRLLPMAPSSARKQDSLHSRTPLPDTPGSSVPGIRVISGGCTSWLRTPRPVLVRGGSPVLPARLCCRRPSTGSRGRCRARAPAQRPGARTPGRQPCVGPSCCRRTGSALPAHPRNSGSGSWRSSPFRRLRSPRAMCTLRGQRSH